MTRKAQCPNCMEPIKTHEHNGCVLFELINVLRDRELFTKKELQEVHLTTDVDALWDDLGHIIDKLGEYGYQITKGETK